MQMDITLRTIKRNQIKYEFRLYQGTLLLGECPCYYGKGIDLILAKAKLPMPCWVIDDISVKEGHRGQGLGTKLLVYALAEIEKLSKIAPIALVPPKSEYTSRLIAWYARHGFALPEKGIMFRNGGSGTEAGGRR